MGDPKYSKIISKIVDPNGNQYQGNAGQLQADLVAAGESSSNASKLANQGAELSRAVANGSNSSSNSAIKSLAGKTSSVLGGAIKGLGDMAFATAYDTQNYNRAIVRVSDIQTAFNTVVDNGINFLAQLGSVFGGITSLLTKAIGDAFEREGRLLEDITTKGGMSGDMAKGFLESVMAIGPEAQRLGIKFDDIRDATASMLTNSQKFTTYQGETLLTALKVSAAYGQTAKSILESAEGYRNIGISLSDASEIIDAVGKRSLAQGLSARATTKTLQENLGKLNEFGFQNGVEGLGRMVQQAQALNFKMEETFKVAAKVFDPEGAISLSANLQVVGGAVGDLADPLKLMYDATNNVEGLQSGILKAAQSLATYNAEQGRFEVTGANLRRAKAMADALGISMEQLTSSAIKGQVQMQAMSQIDLFDLNDDQKQFVANLASMKNGVVGFELPKNLQKELGINQSFIDASSLNGDQMAKIAKAQEKLAGQTTEQTIKDQYNVATQSLNALNSIAMNIGNMARNTAKDSGVYNAVIKKLGGLDEIAKKTPEEIEQVYNEEINKFVNPTLAALKDKADKFIDGAVEVGGKVINKTKEGIDYIGGEGTSEKIKQNAEELYDNTKKFIIEHLFTVNMNSGTPEMAEMLVGEFRRNPKALSDFASMVTKDNKKFLQNS